MKPRSLGLPPHRERVRGVCTGCGGPVAKPRLYWCGDDCVERHRIAASPSYARLRVFERDRGVCAICGVDAEAGRATMQRAAKEAFDRPWSDVESTAWRATYAAAAQSVGLDIDPARTWPIWCATPHTWEADHIVPVAEGGGSCQLENLRTLCRRCHAAETAALAKRRAEARKKGGDRG